MGSTFVRFRGKGFEASDAALEVWLALLVRQIDELDEAAGWLQEARSEWNLQATAEFGFGDNARRIARTETTELESSGLRPALIASRADRSRASLAP